MFYQDNNDYMRDSYYYGNGINNNLAYGMQNPYMPNNFQNQVPIENMYPQIYRIINPVANRVIATSNGQFVTEDLLNNMTDTVFNIVEGDVSSLTSNQEAQEVATTQNSNRGNGATNNPNDRRDTTNSMDNGSNSRLLKDLIKIILIKNLLSRRNGNTNFQNQLPMSYYNPYGYGMY